MIPSTSRAEPSELAASCRVLRSASWTRGELAPVAFSGPDFRDLPSSPDPEACGGMAPTCPQPAYGLAGGACRHASEANRLEVWSLQAQQRIWGSRGTVLHVWVTRPALEPPKGRIHQKYSKEDMTVTLLGGGKEGTEAKKEKQEVDYVLTPEVRQDTGASQTPRITAVSNSPCLQAICQAKCSLLPPKESRVHKNTRPDPPGEYLLSAHHVPGTTLGAF